MSFLAYVKTCRDGIDPEGDFVRDARDSNSSGLSPTHGGTGKASRCEVISAPNMNQLVIDF